MKTNLFFTTLIAVATGTLLATSCSSPTSKGNKFGKKFYKELSDYENFTHVSQFKAKKDSVDLIIKPLIDEYLQECADDTTKIHEFYSVYNKWVDSAMLKYSPAFINCLQKENEGVIWYIENDPNKFFLYAFEDSLNILNCKRKIAYKMHYDTLFFADETSTIAIIDMPTDSTLCLKKANDDASIQFRKANPSDLMRGIWHYRIKENMLGKWRPSWINFKENGHYNGEEWQDGRYTKVRGSYVINTVNDSTCAVSFDKRKKDQINLKGVDKFSISWASGGNEILKRHKRDTPQSLSTMFKK